MNLNFLDFEKPIAEIEAKINELRYLKSESGVSISSEIKKLNDECSSVTKKIFSKLSDWQIAQLARHPQRPYTLDYIEHLTQDFKILSGDRMYKDDSALIGGLAYIDGRRVMVIGHQKGRDTNDRVFRNYGMPKPEGYRKALRLMKLAEKFKLPLITLIDTPGAYPGIGAEKRGQSEAIARNLFEMSQLTIPIISIIIGEGGSGGALAIGVADRVLMLQYGIYSVISPEGCASILWKDATQAPRAAEALTISSKKLLKLGLIDEVVTEPNGGAHRNPEATYKSVKQAILKNLDSLVVETADILLKKRAIKLNSYGSYLEH
jgi:acetyl-CoA carboxylase carboxyl transferase subunit alpha